jgi:DNA-binding transcriptional regulator of glucitol operon
LHNSGLVQKLAIALAFTAFMQVIFAGWTPRYSEGSSETEELGYIGVGLRFCGMNNWCFGYLAGK